MSRHPSTHWLMKFSKTELCSFLEVILKLEEKEALVTQILAKNPTADSIEIEPLQEVCDRLGILSRGSKACLLGRIEAHMVSMLNKFDFTSYNQKSLLCSI